MHEDRVKSLSFGLENFVSFLMSILFIVGAAVGGWIIYDTYDSKYGIAQTYRRMYRPEVVTEEVLKELSEDVVAWLEIDGTEISYPVLQGETNTEYLNRNPYGEYSIMGSIFLDSRNRSDFRDSYSVIYGHHVSGGILFGALDQFVERSYFDLHRTGRLYVGDVEHPFTTVAFLVADGDDERVFDPSFEGDRVEFIMNKAKHIRDGVTLDGRLVALTTCRSASGIDRTILIVRLDG